MLMPKSRGRGKCVRDYTFTSPSVRYCRCRISSSPPRLWLLSVTQSVALPPDPSGAGMSFPSHDRAISLPQVRNSHDAGRCRAQLCWSRFAHA